MAMTNAERQAKYRKGREIEFAEELRMAYRMGYKDAEEGREPAHVELWKDPNEAMAYVCGGMDARLADRSHN